MKIFFFIIFLFCLSPIFAQVDTVNIQLNYNENTKILSVIQNIKYTNTLNKSITKVGFNAWANAYKDNTSDLSKRKLEDRNAKLHFINDSAKGKIFDFQSNLLYNFEDDESVVIKLEKPLDPNQTTNIKFTYSVKIPPNTITSYGYNQEEVLLKYFFLQASITNESGEPIFQNYRDIDILQTRTSFYILKMIAEGFFIESDLPNTQPNIFQGLQNPTPTLYLSKSPIKKYKVHNTEIAFAYNIEEEKLEYVENTILKNLLFLNQYLPEIPAKILLDKKLKKTQNFVGIDNIEITKKNQIEIFTQEEQLDLKLFQQISNEVLTKTLIIDKNKDHWLVNGFQVYFQIKYIEKYYSETKLAGQLPKKIKIFGTHPLDWFFASELNLNDRFKLGYLYIIRQNFDQPINTPFEKFSNINQSIISGFKTGILFNYINDYLGENYLDTLFASFLAENENKNISSETFQKFLKLNSPKNLDWFFDDYIPNTKNINYKLKNFKPNKDSIEIEVGNKTEFPGPFFIVGIKNDSIVEKKWYDENTNQKNFKVQFPLGNYDKLIINPYFIFPEFNDKDNYLYTKGLFKNGKKIQLKLYADIENPEYQQLFISPKIKFNNYDKLILGLKMINYSPLNVPLKLQLNPSYSTGTQSLTGAVRGSYTFYPKSGIFNSIRIGSDFQYFHYDEDLAYQKYNANTSFIFKKEPRSQITQGVSANYNIVNKEPNPNQIIFLEPNKYNLFDLNYFFIDDKKIHEKQAGISFQASDLFTKISTELSYRFEYQEGKKILFRLFAGSFLSRKEDQLDSNYFDFGISRISDYNFSYNLIARSSTSGVFSQQYVPSEGAFISKINETSNQWISTFRTEVPIWKVVEFYSGLGVYKKQNVSSKFIYETGIKLRILPDFLELYFPVQSSLGFELSQKRYYEKIRFTFNFNIQNLVSRFRRGLY